MALRGFQPVSGMSSFLTFSLTLVPVILSNAWPGLSVYASQGFSAEAIGLLTEEPLDSPDPLLDCSFRVLKR